MSIAFSSSELFLNASKYSINSECSKRSLENTKNIEFLETKSIFFVYFYHIDHPAFFTKFKVQVVGF